MLINAPRGTRDIMPEEAYKWRFIEGRFRAICARHGFGEIRTPTFEHTELFRRGVGDTTDIVQKEMYTFEDHGRRSITLKPEGTASCARAFIESKRYAGTQPTKYYYITPGFRYEKPQAGRLREFHQLGIEIFGAAGTLADAEVISLACDLFDDLGIGGLELHINSVGCPVCRADYRKALQDHIRPHLSELCDDCRDRFDRNPMRIIDCKKDRDRDCIRSAPKILDYLCADCRQAFDELKEDLQAMGIVYSVDPDIVRGLDYYTKTAFEFVSGDLGAQSAVGGGGRYDKLIEELGGPEVPGVGFAIGIERLLLLMEERGLSIPAEKGPDLVIAVLGRSARTYGLRLMRELRSRGLSVEMDLRERNLKGQLKYADRIGARYTAVIGDEEMAGGICQLRDMGCSEQKEVKLGSLYDELTNRRKDG